jgi:hypothetical protein
MSTDLGPTWPAIITRIPPRMSPEDYEIYLNWWSLYAASAKRVWYDVGVGVGSPLPPPGPNEQNYRRMWTRNTQKRIDMVADMGNQLWIIELRHAATSNAIGRLLSYDMLWKEDPVIDLPTQLVLVSNHYDGDLDALARAQHILYYTV